MSRHYEVFPSLLRELAVEGGKKGGKGGWDPRRKSRCFPRIVEKGGSLKKKPGDRGGEEKKGEGGRVKPASPSPPFSSSGRRRRGPVLRD